MTIHVGGGYLQVGRLANTCSLGKREAYALH